MMRYACGAVVAALISALTATPADAQQTVSLQLGGGAAKPAATRTSEAGVTVWRGAASPTIELAGGPETRPAPACAETSVTVKIIRRPMNRLRTQGFYSGLGRKGWKFTQGFYSGRN